jgi:lipopolysaccharide transport system permease protein
MTTKEEWDIEISAEQSWLSVNFREIWRYRDLLLMFIKRDVVTTYKQTILGPLWFVIQPLFTTVVFLVIFGRVAQIATDGSPKFLFYMGGIVMWQYFSASLTVTAGTFVTNAAIFGKVYFPRVILPIGTALANLLKFSVQLLLYVLVVLYCVVKGVPGVNPNLALLYFPVLIVVMVTSSLGAGMFITSLSIKYRDIQFLMAFATQLLMYASPIIYPLSSVPEKYRAIMLFNPMCAVVQGTRYGFTGQGDFSFQILYPAVISATVLFVLGFLVYNRMERSFVDTV